MFIRRSAFDLAFAPLLFLAPDDATITGGATPAVLPIPVPAQPTLATRSTVTAADPVPTVGQRIRSLGASNASLLARAEAADKLNEQLTADLTSRQGEIAALRTRAETAEQQLTDARTAINGLEADAKTVSQGVIETVAQLGIPVNALPQQSQDPAAGDAEEVLVKAYQAESNGDKKAEIWTQIKELRARREKAAAGK